MTDGVLTKDLQVLVVDDEKILRDVISRALSYYVTVFTAKNPQDAMSIVKSKNLDLVLVDYNLKSDKTGVELAEEIKSYSSDIIIIMLTGENNSRTVIEALNSNVIDSFLSKPFDIDEIKEYMIENIQNFRSQKENIASIIHRIRSGQEIDPNDLDLIGDEMTHLGNLMFNYRLKPKKIGVEKTIDLLAVVITDEIEIIYSKILDNNFIINNSFMFRGLIQTLVNLPHELFDVSEGAKVLDEIKLPDANLKVRSLDQNSIVVFLSGNQDVPKPVKMVVEEFFDDISSSISNGGILENDGLLDLKVNSLRNNLNRLY